MARTGRDDEAGHRIDEHDERRDDAVGGDLREELLEPGEQRSGRQPLERQRPRDAAQLTHDGGGQQVVPLDVRHHQQHLAAAERDDVVPVAAHLDAGVTGPVPRMQGDLVEPFGHVRQEAALEHERHLVLGRQSLGAVQRLRADRGDRPEEVDGRGVERRGTAELQHQRPEGLPVDGSSARRRRSARR